MTTYTERKTAINRMAEDIMRAVSKSASGNVNILQSFDILDAMPTTHGTVISEIDADAAANPSDAAVQAQKTEKDKIVGDFQAAKADVQAKKTALGI